MGKVIYLTGAPATGKSSLCEELEKRVQNLSIFSYSKELATLIRGSDDDPIDEVSIREKSAKIVTRGHIAALDTKLIDLVKSKRGSTNIVIDSHPVTKEDYGFRITSFSVKQLLDLAPDVVVCLYASSQVIIERIQADPRGRPSPSPFELDLHTSLQANVASQYGMALGKATYLLDSAVPRDDLCRQMIACCNLS